MWFKSLFAVEFVRVIGFNRGRWGKGAVSGKMGERK